MTAENHAAYVPKTKKTEFCECGNLASRKRTSRYICERCYKLEISGEFIGGPYKNESSGSDAVMTPTASSLYWEYKFNNEP